MPIFEFLCSGCNSGFEEYFHRALTGDEKIICPDCGSEDVEKRLSVFSADVPVDNPGLKSGGGCSSGTCGTGMCGLN